MFLFLMWVVRCKTALVSATITAVVMPWIILEMKIVAFFWRPHCFKFQLLLSSMLLFLLSTLLSSCSSLSLFRLLLVLFFCYCWFFNFFFVPLVLRFMFFVFSVLYLLQFALLAFSLTFLFISIILFQWKFPFSAVLSVWLDFEMMDIKSGLERRACKGMNRRRLEFYNENLVKKCCCHITGVRTAQISKLTGAG